MFENDNGRSSADGAQESKRDELPWRIADTFAGIELESPLHNIWKVIAAPFESRTVYVVLRHEVAVEQTDVFGVFADTRTALSFVRGYVREYEN